MFAMFFANMSFASTTRNDVVAKKSELFKTEISSNVDINSNVNVADDTIVIVIVDDDSLTVIVISTR